MFKSHSSITKQKSDVLLKIQDFVNTYRYFKVLQSY